MMEHMGEHAVARRVGGAIQKVLAEGKVRTRDLGGTATTDQFSDAIIRSVEEGE
jgi:isocitrate/isopropylmalate dehydrogenase